MSWHVDPTTLEAYAAGQVRRSAAASVDAHLVACEDCRAQLAGLADRAQLDQTWRGVAAAIHAPEAAPAAVAGRPAGLRRWAGGWLGSGGRPGGTPGGWSGAGAREPWLRVAVPVLAAAVLIAAVGRIVVAGPGGSDEVEVAAPSPSPSPSVTASPSPEPAVEATPTPPPSPEPPPPPPPSPEPPAAQVRAAAARLTPFDACTDLRDHLRAEGGERVTAWGLPGGQSDVVVDLAEPAPDAAADGAGDGAQFGAPPHSETNVQEEGVDEPDLVETDGRHAFVARGDHVAVVDVASGAPRDVTTIELGETHQADLLLDGTRLLVLSRGWSTATSPEPTSEPSAGSAEPGSEPSPDSAEPAPPEPDYAGGHPVTHVTLVDVADPAAPSLVARATVDGRLVNARRIGGVGRLVVHSDPQGLDFVHPDQDRSEEEALTHNRQVVAESEVGQWQPRVAVQPAGGEARSSLLTDCARTHRPPEFAGFGTLSVVTLDLHGDLGDLDATSVLAGGQTVYASARTLYVATSRWYDPAARDEAGDVTTELHAFDLTDPARATYVASGAVTGHLLNQFAMSEHEGFLRVATTEGEARVEASVSSVRVLERRGDLLLPVGQVTGLGPGERIYAVRFMGDVGYVVTFRETDPLYTLDLSDPTAPRVLGELKITGYSAYLHPTAPGRLLGIGQEATEEGRRVGLQLSLFDVSDLSAPTRLDQVVLSQGGSDAEYDHHAFLHWPQTGLVMVPATTWSSAGSPDGGSGGYWSGALGFTLSGDTLSRLGEVSHPSGDPEAGHGPPRIERSFVVGDAVFTVSQAGILGSDLDTLEDRGWLPFDRRG